MAGARAGRKPKPEYLRPVGDDGEDHRPERSRLPVRPEAPAEPDWSGLIKGPDVAAERHKLEQRGDATLLASRRRLDRLVGLVSEARQIRRDAREEWRRIVPELDEWGALAIVDRGLLIDYCVCWAQVLRCERDIARHGLWVEGERGAQKNPAVTAANQYRAQLRFYISELGLSPSSRGRLQLPGQGDPDDDVFDK